MMVNMDQPFMRDPIGINSEKNFSGLDWFAQPGLELGCGWEHSCQYLQRLVRKLQHQIHERIFQSLGAIGEETIYLTFFETIFAVQIQ